MQYIADGKLELHNRQELDRGLQQRVKNTAGDKHHRKDDSRCPRRITRELSDAVLKRKPQNRQVETTHLPAVRAMRMLNNCTGTLFAVCVTRDKLELRSERPLSIALYALHLLHSLQTFCNRLG